MAAEPGGGHRCREKYGAAWAAYCEAVPYRMVPRVW